MNRSYRYKYTFTSYLNKINSIRYSIILGTIVYIVTNFYMYDVYMF